jgi:hypothetical protein
VNCEHILNRNPRTTDFAEKPRPSARIPNLPWIVGGALKSPGGVDELGEIGARAPVEVELGARVVEPIGMIGARDVYTPESCLAFR